MTEMFEDNQGNTSSIRVMSIMALMAAIVFGYIDVINANSQPIVTMAFLLAAFAPKVLQKFAEDKLFEKLNGGKSAKETPQKVE